MSKTFFQTSHDSSHTKKIKHNCPYVLLILLNTLVWVQHEYFEIQVFDSIFVVNTTFSRVGVGKQTSAPTGNGLTGYQARPSFADSCWAFALTNPSGLISRRFCRFLNSRRLVSAFSSASQTNILALVRQVSTPYRSTIVIELH